MASKIIGLKLTINTDAADQNLNDLKAEINKIGEQLKKADIGSDAFSRLGVQVSALKGKYEALGVQLQQQKNYFKLAETAAQAASGSQEQLRATTSALTKILVSLGDSLPVADMQQLVSLLGSLDAELGQAAAATQDLAQVKTLLSTKINANNREIADFNRTLSASDELVGEYSRGIINAFAKSGITEPLQRGLVNLNAEKEKMLLKLRTLTSQLDVLKREGSSSFNAVAEQAEQTAEQISSINRNIETLQRSIKEATPATASTFGSGFVGGATALLGDRFFDQIQNATAGLYDLDNALTRVARTANLTRPEAEQLNEALKGIDTRTSQEQLLNLAAEAGKLGITGVQNLADFTRAADQINVALGEDLGGAESITQLSKISQLFAKFDKQLAAQSIDEQLLRIGSAINTLGQSGTANEQYIVDFLGRTAGTATQVGLSLEGLLAYASVFDELAATNQVGASSFSSLFLIVASDVKKFADIAAKATGITREQFLKLADTDVEQAINTVLSIIDRQDAGLQKLIGTSTLLDTTDKQMLPTLAALASATKINADGTSLLQKRRAEAAKELRENTLKEISITIEAQKAQVGYAATIDRISKAFLLAADNNGFKDAIIAAGNAVIVLINALGVLGRLLAKIDFILVGLTAGFIAYQIAVNGVSTATKAFAFVTKVLDTVMRQTVIARVVTIVIALASALAYAATKSETLRAVIAGVIGVFSAFGDAAWAAANLAGSAFTYLTDRSEENWKRLSANYSIFSKAFTKATTDITGNFNRAFEGEKMTGDLKKTLEKAQSLLSGGLTLSGNEPIIDVNSLLNNIDKEIKKSSKAASNPIELEKEIKIKPIIDPAYLSDALQKSAQTAAAEDAPLDLKGTLEDAAKDIERNAALARSASLARYKQGLLDEQAYRDELSAIEISALQEKATLLEPYSLEYIQLLNDINEREISLTKDKAARILEIEKATTDARYELLTTVVSSSAELLGLDEKNRKKYAGIIKALAITEIAINLQRELSAISAAAAIAGLATGPFAFITAGGIYALQSGIAITKAALATAKVLSAKYEYGGQVPRQVRKGRIVRGRSHAQGGVPIEVEGGEGIINKRSMGIKEVFTLSGTPAQIASQINSMRGYGVPFDNAAQNGIYGQGGIATIATTYSAAQGAGGAGTFNLQDDDFFNRLDNYTQSLYAQSQRPNYVSVTEIEEARDTAQRRQQRGRFSGGLGG